MRRVAPLQEWVRCTLQVQALARLSSTSFEYRDWFLLEGAQRPTLQLEGAQRAPSLLLM
jgi:hypothetical protein